MVKLKSDQFEIPIQIKYLHFDKTKGMKLKKNPKPKTDL